MGSPRIPQLGVLLGTNLLLHELITRVIKERSVSRLTLNDALREGVTLFKFRFKVDKHSQGTA